MAVRTIDAPGIEMHEIDKSQYSPAMTGTKVLVTGFAKSGEDYIPMIFTSKSAWLNYYGEPDNEAERYFYNASMEVLNQNGVVNCCKLPYENEARDKFVAMKYKLNTMTTNSIKTVSEALDGQLSAVKDVLVNSTNYNVDVLRFFASNVNITDSVDKSTVGGAKTINVLSDNVNTEDRSDGLDVASYEDKSFFGVYDVGKLSSIGGLQTAFNQQMNKTDLLKYVGDIEEIAVNPKFKVFYSITNDPSEDDSITDRVTQTIKVYVAKNTSADFAVLSATNTVLSTDEIRFVESIEGLSEFDDGKSPDAKSDDIFAMFGEDAAIQQSVESTDSGLDLKSVNGYVGFRLNFANTPETEEIEFILGNIRSGNYEIVQPEKDSDVEKEATEYFNSLKTNKSAIAQAKQDTIVDILKWSEIKDADPTVKNYWEIANQGNPFMLDMSVVDEYRTDESRVGTNEIVIVDKTRKSYVKIPEDKSHKNDGRELIGVIPIITTAANALYAQKLIDVANDNVLEYETIKDLMTLDMSTAKYSYLGQELSTFNTIAEGELSGIAVTSRRLNNKHTVEDNDDDFFDSVALEANGYFSPITLQADGGFDRENMKKIGLVVVKAYLDAAEGNKMSFQTVEAFVGSLDRDAKNPNTGATTFIDTIVNGQSEYVNIFTNCFPTDAMKTTYRNDVDIFVMPHESANVASMGFYEGMCEEDVDISESILKALDIVYDKVTDINERDLDIVVDAGVSNIAQFIKTVYEKKGFYDPASTDAAMWKCKKDSDVKMWKTVIMKYDNFCKNIRKDCMFIADGPRPYCLQGQKKIVRPSKPTNTIDANILPYTKYLTGINTSYGAGYCDWFQIADEFSGDYFWCPPSIKACGVYINTDLNFNYWDAPAGLNRGVIAALDVAFSPTNKQAGQIYTKSWNYAINYPADGIVLEGQRTLQTKPSALDRVNVRRLMLRLERATYKVLRYVVYEGNTAYMRQRLTDLLAPMFKQAKTGGGLYDYKIICDESNNTPRTIDNNELHISIGFKPTKTIEFIIVNFVLLPTGASWDEML